MIVRGTEEIFCAKEKMEIEPETMSEAKERRRRLTMCPIESVNVLGSESETTFFMFSKLKFLPLKKNIDTIAQNAKDQIMLGDCEEALKLIKQLDDIKI